MPADTPKSAPLAVSDTTAPSAERINAARAHSANKLVKIGGSALALALAVAGFLVLSSARAPQQAVAVAPSDPCRSLNELELTQQGVSCPQRDAFISALRNLQTQLRPELVAISLAERSPDAQQQIDKLETDAVTAFEQRDYASALELVQLAISLASEQIEQAPLLLKEHLAEMVAAFNNQQPGAARTALDEATRIDPANPLIARYRSRINALPDVMEQLRNVGIAQVENRPQVELAALERVLQLDPIRTGPIERIRQIKQQQREQRYGTTVQRAEAALANGKLAAARKLAADAGNQYPARDLSFLTRRIATAARARSLSNSLARAQAARVVDDWQSALQAYEAALQIDAASSAAVTGRNDATILLAAFRSLQNHLEKPIRLATPRVARHVRGELAELQAYRKESLRLAQLFEAVEDVLSRAEVPVNVAVLSDGKTHVEVRRVGVVGKHRHKVIQLTPGEYQLEGRRRGYKSKLVFLEVPLDVASVEVTVACNELI